jgi:hypothetical protein
MAGATRDDFNRIQLDSNPISRRKAREKTSVEIIFRVIDK